MNILVINCGSSSLKYQLINSESEEVLAKGLCERIGGEGSCIKHTPAGGEKVTKEIPMPDHTNAIQAVIDEVNYYNATLDNDYAAIYGNLYSFDSYLDSYFEYGNGIGIYGLPSFDGRGPSTCSHEFVCVSASTSFPEACAEYVKILLSYDVQITMYNNPINRQALTAVAEEQLEAYNKKLLVYGVDGRPATEADLIPHEAIDKYIDILSSSYGNGSLNAAIENILYEESSAYFNGQRALDDVIPVMQDRIQTVLDENK